LLLELLELLVVSAPFISNPTKRLPVPNSAVKASTNHNWLCFTLLLACANGRRLLRLYRLRKRIVNAFRKYTANGVEEEEAEEQEEEEEAKEEEEEVVLVSPG
jgi:hypothetical protein